MAHPDRAILFKQIDRLYRDGTFTAQSDGQLLNRYLAYRDEGAFEAIVNLHGPMVLSLCRRFLRDPRDIEDAFQATFLVLARKAGSIRDREVLSSWLYGVAYRIAIRSRSEVLKRRSVEAGIALLDDHASAAASDVDEIGPVLDQELNRLPEKYRAPIVLCYLKEQTHDQAAAALRWPVGTVRSRLARGRELLRKRLTRRGCSPATAMLIAGPRLGAPGFRSFTAPVPQALVQSTVEAAGRYLWGVATGAVPGALALSSSSSLSGSVTALTQGVLLTMSLSQIKFIAAGLVAGGLGAGAAAWALGSPGPVQQPATALPKQKEALKPAAEKPSSPLSRPDEPVPLSRPSPTSVEARLAELERKLDLLLQRFNPPQASPGMLPPPRQEGPGDVLSQPRAVPDGIPLERKSDMLPQPESQPEPKVPTLAPTAAASTPLVESPRGEQVARGPQSLAPIGASSHEEKPGLPTPSAEAMPVLSNPTPDTPQAQPASPGRLEPSLEPARFTQAARASADPFQEVKHSPGSLREIEAQIQFARRRFERNKALHAAAAISRQDYEEPLNQIRILIARLEGMGEDYSDELQRLKIEILKKQAELKMAEADHEVAAANVSLQTRINLRKPGMVSKEDVIKCESESASASAKVQVRQAELQDTELRMGQVNRRLETTKRIADEVLKALPEIASERGPAPEFGDFPPPRR